MLELPRITIPDHTLIRKIGEGGYGEIWLARSITGEYRAVKIVSRDLFEDDRPYEREF
ncbi:MAG: serine/threonine protein kinase [Verrucomicrobiales bacterium]|jgi:serine/threonine protein kinase